MYTVYSKSLHQPKRTAKHTWSFSELFYLGVYFEEPHPYHHPKTLEKKKDSPDLCFFSLMYLTCLQLKFFVYVFVNNSSI